MSQRAKKLKEIEREERCQNWRRRTSELEQIRHLRRVQRLIEEMQERQLQLAQGVHPGPVDRAQADNDHGDPDAIVVVHEDPAAPSEFGLKTMFLE